MNPLFKAIVVDDEPAARRLLKSLLLEHYEVIEVIAEAGNGKDAVKLIQELKPDVVFLDIQMPDLTGFEVIEQLNYQPNIIFTTAYEQYALKAFESFSIDYILKPIREERLKQSLEKLKSFGKVNKGINISNIKEIIEQLHAPKKATALPIKTGEKIILLRFEKIAYLEANDKYVNVFMEDGQKYLTDQTLTALEEKLPEPFLRVQKSYIINKDKIKEVHKHFNGRFVLTLDDKGRNKITTGLTYNEAVKSALGLI